jgi:HlyD family secretion protein
MHHRCSAGLLVLVSVAAAGAACTSVASSNPGESPGTVRVTRRAFTRTIRVTGLVEAVQSSTLIVPRLQGPGSGILVVTRLTPGGTMVRKGDVVVQFDPQAQERVAFDRRAEYEDFAAKLSGKEAEHASSRTADESALIQAKNAVERARLEMLKNEMLGAILVEKNQQTLAEAEATLDMLRRTFDVKRRAERAERKALEIQRDRARNAMEHARQNIAAMTMRAPQDGLLVLKTVWKNGQVGEVQEGEETRPGLPLVDIVDPARMQVRARVNQADAPLLRPGQRATVELDAYPGKRFTARVVSIAPAGVTSVLSPRVRTFGALFLIEETDAALLPDLTAAVDVELERQDEALVVPRESIGTEGNVPVVWLNSGDMPVAFAVTIGTVNDTEAVVTGGLRDGAIILKQPVRGGRPGFDGQIR